MREEAGIIIAGIQRQKEIADDILLRLFPIDPFAIVAGGAPRDWYHGNLAQDIDVYFYTAVTQRGVVETMLDHVGFGILKHYKKYGNPAHNDYSKMKVLPHLKRVFRFDHIGISVHLVQMSEPTFSVVDNFDLSINRIWYKNGEIHPEREFLLGEKLKLIMLKDGYFIDDPHPAKIKKRFPDYQMISRSGLVHYLEEHVMKQETA